MPVKSSKQDKQLIGQFSLEILNIPFNILLYSSDYYLKLHPDTAACVLAHRMPSAHFSISELDKVTIYHEVFHMYLHAIHINSLHDLSADDLEELACDTFAYRYKDIIKDSDSIYKKLLLMRKRHERKR